MQEFLSILLQAVLIAAVPVIAGFAAKGLTALAQYLGVKIENTTVAKYAQEITQAVTTAVTYVSQTYVDALKNAGEFTLEAQKEALRKSLAACIASISPAAQAFIEQAYGDMTQYLTTKIEAEVRKQKLDTPITLALPVAESETDTTAIAASTAAATAATIAQTAVNQLKSEPTVKAAD